MGCAPSKGSTIAVQPAVTPRAGPEKRQPNPPPVTPPLTTTTNRNKSNNPLDEKRPLPAIGGLSADISARRPSGLTTVPEQEEGSLSQRLPKLDVNAMAQDARESEGSKDVKHTQSSVAFTFDFGGDSSQDIKPAGRLPPLIREKTIRKSTEAGELKSSIERRQQEADDRRQNELNSIAGKKKRRKVKLKSAKVSNNFSSQQSIDSAAEVVPPLEISSSPDKNGSPASDTTIPRNPAQQNTTSTPVGTTVTAEIEPRKGSAYHDSTYGSDDENADANNRVVDPLRRFSKKRGVPNSNSNKTDDGFYGKSDEIENINPMEAAQFFDDSTDQM